MTTTANANSDRFWEQELSNLHHKGARPCDGFFERVEVTQRITGKPARIYMCPTCKKVIGITE